MIYAGIGARATPPAVLARMTTIARVLAVRGWTLSSGGADGADQAFERGAREHGGPCRIYLPWPRYEAERRGVHAGDPRPRERRALARGLRASARDLLCYALGCTILASMLRFVDMRQANIHGEAP